MDVVNKKEFHHTLIAREETKLSYYQTDVVKKRSIFYLHKTKCTIVLRINLS